VSRKDLLLLLPNIDYILSKLLRTLSQPEAHVTSMSSTAASNEYLRTTNSAPEVRFPQETIGHTDEQRSSSPARHTEATMSSTPEVYEHTSERAIIPINNHADQAPSYPLVSNAHIKLVQQWLAHITSPFASPNAVTPPSIYLTSSSDADGSTGSGTSKPSYLSLDEQPENKHNHLSHHPHLIEARLAKRTASVREHIPHQEQQSKAKDDKTDERPFILIHTNSTTNILTSNPKEAHNRILALERELRGKDLEIILLRVELDLGAEKPLKQSASEAVAEEHQKRLDAESALKEANAKLQRANHRFDEAFTLLKTRDRTIQEQDDVCIELKAQLRHLSNKWSDLLNERNDLEEERRELVEEVEKWQDRYEAERQRRKHAEIRMNQWKEFAESNDELAECERQRREWAKWEAELREEEEEARKRDADEREDAEKRGEAEKREEAEEGPVSHCPLHNDCGQGDLLAS